MLKTYEYLPNCKINIGLDVLRRRSDGFHDIESVLYPVDGLRDILEVVPAGGTRHGIEFSCSGLAMECAVEDNLVVRAYRLMAERYPKVGGVKVHLHKVIPHGAGLGGGSSDCAFLIKALNELFHLNMKEGEMEQLCGELGSDIAFFVHNIPQLASGRGEILRSVELSLKGKWVVIVKPEIAISTAQAYGEITPRVPDTALERRISELPIELWRGKIVNQFESHLFTLYPPLEQIKDQLYSLGATYASMTGSGSALYGLFEGSGVDEVMESLKGEFGELFVYRQQL